MNLFGKVALVFLFAAGIFSSGCDLTELSNDQTQPRCEVSYNIIFINTSEADMYMGTNAQAAASDLVQAGGSRTQLCETISLLTSAGYEEELPVEMHVRSMDGQTYKYASYTILPKNWSPTVDPTDFKRATLSLQINCTYNGTDVAVNATQL